LRCKYLTAEDAEILDRSYEQILGQLVSMIENPAAWTVGANRKVNQ